MTYLGQVVLPEIPVEIEPVLRTDGSKDSYESDDKEWQNAIDILALALFDHDPMAEAEERADNKIRRNGSLFEEHRSDARARTLSALNTLRSQASDDERASYARKARSVLTIIKERMEEGL